MPPLPASSACPTATAAAALGFGTGLCLLLMPVPEGFAAEGPGLPDQPVAPAAGTRTWAESLENLGRLHQDAEDSWLQELWFLGRYHGQYHWAEGSAGEDDGGETRRFRMGGQAQLFQKLTLHAQMVSGTDFDPFYNGFTELWAGWTFTDAVLLTVGQQKHRFTHERTVSSRYLNTVERSLLVNMFELDYTPAVTLSGRAGRFSYYTGVFSNATGRNLGVAFTEFDSGYSLLASVTYDLGDALGTDTAHVNLGFLHSDANDNATNLGRFGEGLSSALILTDGPGSLVTEVMTGLGGVDGDAVGLTIQPGWFLTDKVQLVGRYQVSASNSDVGLRAQRRYERPTGLTTGEFYQAAYVGLNYHLAAHRIKLMTGAEYSTLGGEPAWTVVTAIRVFWGPHSRGPFPMAQVLKAR